MFDHKHLNMHKITLFLMQVEFEHHSPKSRYACTDHKSFVEQLTIIECRQAHICHICAMNKLQGQVIDTCKATTINTEEHYFIGKSQNFPVNIPTFLRENQGDPAIKVRATIRQCVLVMLAESSSHPNVSGLLAKADRPPPSFQSRFRAGVYICRFLVQFFAWRSEQQHWQCQPIRLQLVIFQKQLDLSS